MGLTRGAYARGVLHANRGGFGSLVIKAYGLFLCRV